MANIDSILLPSNMGGLQQLETFQFEIYVPPGLGRPFCPLPPDIVCLSNLLHLIVPWWIRLPDGIGNLKSLRTLRVNVSGMNWPEVIKGLGELTNLTRLEIGWYNVNSITSDEVAAVIGRKVLRTCLEKLSNLKYLHMTNPFNICLDLSNPVAASFCHLQRLHAYCSWFSRVPEWFGLLHDLYDLKLIVKEVLEDDVGLLAQLPSLMYLNLRLVGTPKDSIVVCGGGLPVLKHFALVCSRIPCLTFHAGAMAKLERLELTFNALGWDRYGAAPAGIEHISGLKKISVNILVGGAKESNGRAAHLALRNAVDMHPGRPTANIECRDKEIVVFDSAEDE